MLKSSVKILSFYKNQAEIIAKHCINKDKPKLKCKGHCYLKKQLKEERKQQENNAVPEVSMFLPIAVELHSILAIIQPDYGPKRFFAKKTVDPEQNYLTDIFVPPQEIVI